MSPTAPTSPGILSLDARRSRHRPHRDGRLDRGRHGHRGGRPLDAREDPHAHIDPAEGFQPHHGRAVAFALNLKGDLNKQAAKVAEQLYNAFIATDMSMLEINPLVETVDGKILVLDAKVSFDSNSLYRHPDILALRDETEEDPAEVEASKYDLAYIKLMANIGCMVNGAGLAMATMDIIKLNGAFPANFLDVAAVPTRRRSRRRSS
jgi:succinyl-CoA synthetase beta subunit